MSSQEITSVFTVDESNQNIDNPHLKSIQINAEKKSGENDEYLIKLDAGTNISIDIDARFNSKLSVFDASGNKIAANSSNSRIEADEGNSPYKYDPYVSFDVEHHGVYTLVLENGSGAYVLNLSKDVVAFVLEDSKDNLVNVLGDGVDDKGGSLIIKQVGQPQHGSTELVDNQILYTPSKDYFGKDEFSYVYFDGERNQISADYELLVVDVYDIDKSDFKMDIDNIAIDDNGLPTASISATKASADDQYYSLYLLAGERVVIDVDARFNSKLTLSDINGNEVASNGSSSRIETDEIGSIYKYDPFIEYKVVNAGDYQIKLENGSGDYQLHVSKDSSKAVIVVESEVDTTSDKLTDSVLTLSATTLTAHYASLALNDEDYSIQSVDAVSRIRMALDFNALKSQLNGTDKITGIEFTIQTDDKLGTVSDFATQDNNQWLMEVDFLSNFNAAIVNNITGDVIIQHIPGIASLTNNKVDLIDIYLNPKTGVDQHTITLTNIVILTDIGKVTLNDQHYIADVTRGPVTADDIYSVKEDSVIGVDINTIINNDLQFIDSSYPLENVSFVTDFKLGVVNDKGIYIPNKNASGVDIANYQLNDNNDRSNVSSITINITSVNDVPIAQDDYFENVLLEDGKGVDITHIINNDNDAEDGSLLYENITFISEFSNGKLTEQGFYTPNANYYGIDKASYVVKDSSGATSLEAGIAIEVEPVNDKPSGAVSILGVIEIGEVLTVDNNLQDEDGLGDISYQWLRGGQYIAGAGSNIYTISRDDIESTLSVQAVYTDQAGTKEMVESDITEAVKDNNIAPVATDDLAIMLEDSNIKLNLLANDQDDDVVTIYNYTSPKHGALSESSIGQLTYTPDLNFTGNDAFKYSIQDVYGAISNQAKVDLLVSTDNITFKPIKISDSSTISLSEALVLLNKEQDEKSDSSTSVLKFDVVLDASKIDLFNVDAQSITGAQFKINPTSLNDGWLLGYQLNDSFDLSVINTENATFAIGNNTTVVDNDTSNDSGREKIINTQSVATVFVDLGNNDESIDISLQEILLEVKTTKGEYVSIAPSNFSTNLSIDPIQSATKVAQELLEAKSITEAVLKDDVFFVNEDEASSLNVLMNDQGLDVDITSFTDPSHGSIKIKEAGELIYTADENYHGLDSFSYLTNQNNTPTTVDIKVISVNDKPSVSEISTQTINENALFSIDLSSYFSDADIKDTLTYQATTSGNTNLPSWLTLDSSTGILSGTPKNQDVANLDITALALDGNNSSAKLSFDLFINEKADSVIYDQNNTLLDNITLHYFSNDIALDAQHLVDKGDINIKEDILFDCIKVDEGQYTQDAINISDAISVLRHIVELDPIESSSAKYHAADVNNDGTVNISDAISILRHVVDLKELDTFDLIDAQGNRVVNMDINTPDITPEYQLIANGDVDFSGDFIVSVDIV